MSKNFYAVILAGGGGTRLWPKSRKAHPKHLLNLTGKNTLVRSTFDRLTSILSPEQIFVVTMASHAPQIEKQIPELVKKNVIIEPEAKNTALAMATASAFIHAQDPEAIVINLPADHMVEKINRFEEVILGAFESAAQGDYLVAIGIKPTSAHTGLGYIKIGEQAGKVRVDGKDVYAFKAKGFKEKPDLATAQSFIASGQYLWNAGMYAWSTKSLFAAIDKYASKLAKNVKEILEVIGTPQEEKVLEKVYENADNVSIDYAVSEKVDNLIVIPGDFGWSDVGDWKVVFDVLEKDKQGNVIAEEKQEQLINIDSKNCLIETNGRLIATVGLENLIVIDTEDVILICAKDKTQDVKKVVERLKELKKDRYL